MDKRPITLNGKNILVTGSPGFIGANLVLRLLRELTGGHVISFDNTCDSGLNREGTQVMQKSQ